MTTRTFGRRGVSQTAPAPVEPPASPAWLSRKQKWILGAAAVLTALYIAGGEDKPSTPVAQATPALPPVLTPGFKAFDVAVWSDPRARYKVLDVKALGGGVVQFVSTQTNSLGTSYAMRETDCLAGRFRYTAEADDLEGLRKPSPVMTWGQLTSGSISTILSAAACEHVGLRLKGVMEL